MKIQTLLFLLILSHITFGQIGNNQDVIIKNRVRSSLEKHCFTNSEGSCSIIYEEYDQRGNNIEWDMWRMSIVYRDVYDENNNVIMTLWIDKADSTEVDTQFFKYDVHNELIQQVVDKDTTEIKNTYDKAGRLIKSVAQSKNIERNIVKNITIKTWTSFNKVETETTRTEIIETNKKTKYKKNSTSKVEYTYDKHKNLSKKTHYKADTISKTISYQYDSKNRLIQELEDNPPRAKLANNMKFSNRKDIQQFKTTVTYNNKEQIEEVYTYFSDPCMSLDNHFLYKHHYLSNGLINFIDVYENEKLTFSIKYQYEYFE